MFLLLQLWRQSLLRRVSVQFIGEWYLEIKIWALVVLTGTSSFSGQSWETDVYMVTYAEAPIYISVYITCVYIFVCVGG